MHPMPGRPGLTTRAAAAGVVANTVLGASSLYWRALGGIAPTTLLAWRILISLATLAAVLGWQGGLRALAGRLSLRLVAVHASAALLVVINWGTFIWASIHGHVLESGLGYLLAPFVAIGVGALLLGDRMSRPRLAALALIVGAVGALMRGGGELAHWVYLTIGLTWGGYACLKKWTTLDAFGGLFVETVVLAALLPLALLATPFSLALPAGAGVAQLGLLALCGLVSVVPLALFSFAAAHLPLSVMGFFQFVLPSTQLVVALAVYRQPVSAHTLTCFGVIWLGLGAIVLEPLWRSRRAGTAPATMESR